MKLFIILFVWAFQSINGDEGSLNQAIENGKAEIAKRQKDWLANTATLKTVITDCDSKFTAELDKIANFIKDKKDKLKAFSDFKALYMAYVSQFRKNTEVAEKDLPNYIANLFRPSELYEAAYTQITSVFKNQASGNPCVAKLAVDAITNTTACILTGLNETLAEVADVDSALTGLPSLTDELIVEIKKCPESKGTSCFDSFTRETNISLEDLKPLIGTFPKDVATVITQQKANTISCTLHVTSIFNSTLLTVKGKC